MATTLPVSCNNEVRQMPQDSERQKIVKRGFLKLFFFKKSFLFSTQESHK